MSVAPWVNDKATAVPVARQRSTKTRGSVATTPRVPLLRRVAAHGLGFIVLSSVSYGFLALLGHSLHSSALKVRENNELRAEGAREDVLDLGKQVASLASTEALDRWAIAHGFVKVGRTTSEAHVTVAFRKGE